jgi:transcriptional regulator with XRE-family HTH domain
MKPNWFAEALRIEMTRRRMSQRSMATFLGKGKSAVTQWLAGTRHPAFADLCDACERLGWDLGLALPPALRESVELVAEEGGLDLSRFSQVFEEELLDLMFDAIESDDARVRHFAYAVLEDSTLQFTDAQARALAARLPAIASDKRAFLSSHVVMIGTRLLRQTDSVVPFLGDLLCTSTNVLTRYRIVAAFLDHPAKRPLWIHFVRSALLGGSVKRDAYELECMNLAALGSASNQPSYGHVSIVESLRQSEHSRSIPELVEVVERAMHRPRGEFAWYHAIEAAGRSGREGAALLMQSFSALSGERSSESKGRRQDIVATINRAGLDQTALCLTFLQSVMFEGDAWIAFHSAAALGKRAIPSESAIRDISRLLEVYAANSENEDIHVAAICCYALAKMGAPSPEALAALGKCRKSKSPWLRAVARIAGDSLREPTRLQDVLARMLKAA